jgi:hypothetical protein
VDDFISFKLKKGEKSRQPIDVKLFRLDGSPVFEKEVAGGDAFTIPRNPGWPGGLYLYELRSAGQLVQSGKVVLK